MIVNSFPLLDAVDSPEEDGHGVEQGENGNDGERNSRRERYPVAKVEERGGDGAQDDGELELK